MVTIGLVLLLCKCKRRGWELRNESKFLPQGKKGFVCYKRVLWRPYRALLITKIKIQRCCGFKMLLVSKCDWFQNVISLEFSLAGNINNSKLSIN